MIGRILYKDWKLLWPLVGLVVLIQACLEWAWYRYGFFGEDRVARQLIDPLTIAWYAGIAGLTIAVVQLDAVPALDQDWLIRPLKRTDLLIAKLLFIAVTVCLPMFALDVARALAMGFPAAACLWEAALKESIVAAWLLVPVLALSALASTLLELLILGATLIGVYAVALSVSALLGAGSCPTCDTGVAWLEQLMQHVGVLLGAGVILALQYYRRSTRLSRVLALLGVLALVFVQLPWKLAFAAQSRLSAAPGTAASIAISFNPAVPAAQLDGLHSGRAPTAGQAARALLAGDIDAAVRYLQRLDTSNTPVRIDLPVRISGLADDELLLVDRSQVRLFGRAGGELYHGVNSGALGPQTAPRAGSVHFAAQAVYVPARAYRRGAEQPLRLGLDYSLTLLKLVTRHRIAALNGQLSAPDAGRCETQLNESGTSIALRCRKLGTDLYCFSATLMGPGGRHNPEVLDCDPNYRPDLPGYTDLLRFYGVNIPVRDPSGLSHYPVEPADLGRAYVLVKIYAARDHFSRALAIPHIRLSEWRPRAP